MTARHHRLYVDSTIALAKTLVIKSEYSAVQINNQVALRFGANAVNTLDKTSWKYYLNVSGEYHPTDTMIRVKSLDTMQEMDFTKENLVINTATARGYMPGTRYYRELLTKYPEHRLLIHGILFPADIDKAIAAPDFSVLSYPPEMVESNEELLISEINAWLQTQNQRWYVNEFNITDELYAASFLMVMYQQLVPLILTLRRKACKTSFAHSYHVRQYLISHGMIEAYIDEMTQKQRMFFYRNIRFIHRHAGKEDTFQWLTDNVLSARGMPLAQYDAIHQTTDMPEAILPTVKFRARSLTTVSSMARPDTDVAGILSKEIALAPGNLEESVFSRESIQESFTYTQTAIHPTKVLESASIQTSSGSSRNLQETALNLWAYAASTGRYNSYVFVTDPATGAELSMPALVAYHYFAYAFYKAHNIELETVPPVLATEVPKWPGFSLADLMKLVNTNDIDESLVFNIWNNHPAARTFLNTDSFFDSVQELADAQNTQLLMTSIPETFMGRGMAQAVYEALYPTYVYETASTGEPIKEYLAPYDLTLDGLDTLQWQQLYLGIFTAATGQSLTSTQARTSMQKAMISIMTRLSSYSVQFVSEVSSSEMQSLNWQSMRFGPGVNSGRLYYWLVQSPLDINGETIDAKTRYSVELPSLFNRFSMRVPKKVTETIDVGFEVQGFVNVTLNAESIMAFDGVRMLYDSIPTDTTISRLEDLPGMDGYEGYTVGQLTNMVDVYSHVCRTYPLVPTKISLDDKFNSFNLPIFKALDYRNSLIRPYQGYSVSGSLRYFRNEVFVVVLDGFESNVGDLTVDALNPVMGRDFLNMFSYVPDFVIENIPHFKYTGGLLKLGSIRPGISSTDMTAPVFSGTPTQVNVALSANAAPPEIMVSVRQAKTLLQFGFSQLPPTIEFGFVPELKMFMLNLLKTSKPSIVLNIAQAVRNLQIPLFTTVNRTLTTPIFTGRTRGYVIPNFKQTFIAQGPVLLSFGIQILDEVEQAAPVEVVDTDLGVEFASVSKVLSGPELEMTNNTRVLDSNEFDFASVSRTVTGVDLDLTADVKTIDIPDFEDLFNEPD